MFRTEDYSFHLPPELIATEALPQRSDSRLLVVNRKTRSVSHLFFYQLPFFLQQQAVLDGHAGFSLVANNSKVFRARLLGKREGSQGKVEFFLLKKTAQNTWQGLMRTQVAGARIVPGFKFWIENVSAEVLLREETPDGVVVTAVFSEDPVERGLGEVPLPPYILAQRKKNQHPHEHPDELEKYNTIFAKASTVDSGAGSVAAPTAGRHFTPELIQELKSGGNRWHEITLHVGLGTFKPVKAADLREHRMHAENATITPEVAEALMKEKSLGRKILTIGTTATRTLEAFYDRQNKILTSGTRDVSLFIHPGSQHQWGMVDALLTNFHLPESTLLMMVADFISQNHSHPKEGLEWLLALYQEAIDLRYRFYSYGDAMLIL